LSVRELVLLRDADARRLTVRGDRVLLKVA
jgi:hypothetical protein